MFVCAQDDKVIVTTTPCHTRSEDHLKLTWGGFTGGMKLYADFCDAYNVTLVGEFEVVGEPEFDYRVLTWGEYVERKDSLDALEARASQSECRFYYSE